MQQIFTMRLIKCHVLCLLLRVDIHKPSVSLQEYILKRKHLQGRGASIGGEVLPKHQDLNSILSTHIHTSMVLCL